MAMSLNIILIQYVIPCLLSNDFNKLNILYNVHDDISLIFYDK